MESVRDADAATRRWIATPRGGVIALIVATLAIRLLFAGALGLGIDESYMVASGRALHLSYFDHPPVSWWMALGAARVLGTDAAWAVRLPFVLLFAGTTWLMFVLTRNLFDDRAGLCAAILMNLAPVLGVTTATWVLPDGPLIAALLGAAVCLVAAVSPDRRANAWHWWLGAGACAGLALLSKYSAILTIGGAFIYLATEPAGRRWLRTPQPYAAGLLAVLMFVPVIVWNAQHNWASFVFQGGRAGVSRFYPFGPLSALGGEALFLLPWLWLPLIGCGVMAAWRGPRDPRSWFLVCLAFPPILVFEIVSLWSHVLFHWAAPGYLLLFPLLGRAVARPAPLRRGVRVWIGASAVLVIVLLLVVSSQVRFNWLPAVIEVPIGKSPDLDAVDWTTLRTDLAARGMLGRPGLIVAATRWSDAGKADYALGGAMPVICLGDDPREYGFSQTLSDYAGKDVIIVAPRRSRADIVAEFGSRFDAIEDLAPVTVLHNGRPALLLPLFLGRNFHPPAKPPYSS
jgi:4-amino-4-deoxy-L-arabinose transferase-like glycosyltransferase